MAITSVFQTEEMGSIPIIRFEDFSNFSGSMPEWLKGVDCKSTDESLHKFESYSAHESPFGRRAPKKPGELFSQAKTFMIKRDIK